MEAVKYPPGRILLPSAVAIVMVMFIILTIFKSCQIDQQIHSGKSSGNSTPVLNVTGSVKAVKLLLELSFKSHLAASEAEMMEKKSFQIDPEVESTTKRKRHASEALPVPWICETKHEWKDLGANYYPRFIRTAECSSKFCVRGFFKCLPKHYKTRILKRILPNDNSTDEDVVELPEPLERSSWKIITMNIQLCCECSAIPRSP